MKFREKEKTRERRKIEFNLGYLFQNFEESVEDSQDKKINLMSMNQISKLRY